MKELYLLMEEEEMNAQHSDNKACTGDSWTQNTVCLTPLVLPYPYAPCPLVSTSCFLLSPDWTQRLQMVIALIQAHQLLSARGHPRVLTEGRCYKKGSS